MTLCGPHRRGVPPDSRRFYCPNCPVCERKLAMGLVSVADPRAPLSFRRKFPNWGTMFVRHREAKKG